MLTFALTAALSTMPTAQADVPWNTWWPISVTAFYGTETLQQCVDYCSNSTSQAAYDACRQRYMTNLHAANGGTTTDLWGEEPDRIGGEDVHVFYLGSDRYAIMPDAGYESFVLLDEDALTDLAAGFRVSHILEFYGATAIDEVSIFDVDGDGTLDLVVVSLDALSIIHDAFGVAAFLPWAENGLVTQ